MSYELLVLPVPAGADVEDEGEALEVRLEGGHEQCSLEPAAASRRGELSAAIYEVDQSLSAGPSDGAPLSLDGGGLRVEVSERYVRLLVEYSAARDTDETESLFERVFGVLLGVAECTGWRVYDPQGTTALALDDEGRATTMELFLSVADHLAPGGAARG